VVEKIVDLIEERGITAYRLASDLGFNSGKITQWKQGLQKPSVDAVVKIADYFGVTTDYLLKGEDSVMGNKIGVNNGVVYAQGDSNAPIVNGSYINIPLEGTKLNSPKEIAEMIGKEAVERNISLDEFPESYDVLNIIRLLNEGNGPVLDKLAPIAKHLDSSLEFLLIGKYLEHSVHHSEAISGSGLLEWSDLSDSGKRKRLDYLKCILSYAKKILPRGITTEEIQECVKEVYDSVSDYLE